MAKDNQDRVETKPKNSSVSHYSQHPALRKLTPLEKKFLLAVEHGDAATVQRILSMLHKDPSLPLDVNCKDPVGRSAILMTIDNENLEMLELLLENGLESRDALLHAINAEYVEAVELLLDHEEIVHKEGEPHSWEKVERDITSFTPEITPLILAAHKDNYEILKILLDRGATLPMPHDIRCHCGECVRAMNEDCLCHSRSRINAYRALSSPSLICLSSIDPVLTAFELSCELRRLSLAENEFKEDYQKLRFRCQDFATALLAQVRTSQELGVILKHDPDSSQSGKDSRLTRVQMALKYKQKKFIAHPNVQQLMSSLWYDGLPGFRKLNSLHQLWEIIKIGVLFPLYSVIYMLFPNSEKGKLIRKPFFKFILHSFSYLFFLFLLILASQRVETVIVQLFGTEQMKLDLMESLKKQRGQAPTVIETSILLYIIAHIWQETSELWKKGVVEYLHNMWNLIDFTRNLLHALTAALRILAYIQAQSEIRQDPMAVYIPREAWDAFDPMLIADGLFAAGNVFAALKLVHIFSINPYLGPLQISLGRMVIDIIKFFFIYSLVLFAFACGLNQLLWYYAEREKSQCFTGPGGTENWVQQRDSCLAWRRFSNLFESSQTLFWASFGLVDISNFELSGIKTYTRFWGLLMFGSYSVINVVVLLNLLIAMMSNSYQIISERADVEWKFARTTLFMNYFEEGSTVPPPFNLFPTLKNVRRLFKKDYVHQKSLQRNDSNNNDRDAVYESVMCNLVWRYVTAQQKSCEEDPVTEDNINELRQDILSFRHDLMHVLRCNGMTTKGVNKVDIPPGKKIQIRKRRLLKDFSIGLMEVCTEDATSEYVPGRKSVLARLVGLSGGETSGSQRWRDLIQLAKNKKIIGNKGDGSGTIKKEALEEEKTTKENENKNNVENTWKQCENSTSGSNVPSNLPSPILPIPSTPRNSVTLIEMEGDPNPREEQKQKSGSFGIELSPVSFLKPLTPTKIAERRPSPTSPQKSPSKSIQTNENARAQFRSSIPATTETEPRQETPSGAVKRSKTAPPPPPPPPLSVLTQKSITGEQESTSTSSPKTAGTTTINVPPPPLPPTAPPKLSKPSEVPSSQSTTDTNAVQDFDGEQNTSVAINVTFDQPIPPLDSNETNLQVSKEPKARGDIFTETPESKASNIVEAPSEITIDRSLNETTRLTVEGNRQDWI